jgi:hypothetical protein
MLPWGVSWVCCWCAEDTRVGSGAIGFAHVLLGNRTLCTQRVLLLGAMSSVHGRKFQQAYVVFPHVSLNSVAQPRPV